MELAQWYAVVDCVTCEQVYGSKLACPCSTCQPTPHPCNLPVLHLYGACSDQLIVGPSGAVSLNDLSIGYAMDTYFKVRKKEKLGLSQAVRKLYSMILKFQKDNANES